MNKDGKSKPEGIRRDKKTDESYIDSDGCKEVGSDGYIDRSEPERACGEICSGGGGSSSGAGFLDGGILGQLGKIKDEYLDYIRAHKERLKARLAEDEEKEKEAVSDLEKLEADIRRLVISKDKSN